MIEDCHKKILTELKLNTSNQSCCFDSFLLLVVDVFPIVEKCVYTQSEVPENVLNWYWNQNTGVGIEK